MNAAMNVAMNVAMNAALKCSGLVKRFDDVTAVNGVDLEVKRGERC